MQAEAGSHFVPEARRIPYALTTALVMRVHTAQLAEPPQLGRCSAHELEGRQRHIAGHLALAGWLAGALAKLACHVVASARLFAGQRIRSFRAACLRLSWGVAV